MALKGCKECGSEVSTRAKKCPRCGVDDPTTNKLSGCLTLIGGLVVFMLIGSIFSDDEDDSYEYESPRRFAEVSLNVRSGPSTEHEAISTLSPGEKFEVTQDSSGWIEISSTENETAGWVSRKYTSSVSKLNEWESEQNYTTETTANTSTSNQVDWEPVLNAIDKSRETGLLQRVEKAERSLYVNPFVWQAVDAETKENIVTVFARYMGYLTDMDQAVGITVKDSQSGKDLATYSVWSGVNIE